MLHNQENCPWYPKPIDKLPPFKNDKRYYREYRGMCRTCGREWDMLIQNQIEYLKSDIIKP